jgi:hypothetical protein
MEVADSARKHGVTDRDMRHAVRVPTTWEVVTMANTKARGSVEDWLDSLDPATGSASDAADLRRIGAAVDRAETAEQELIGAIAAARKKGRSWSTIGMVLGISKQAAQQRFGAKLAT